MNKRWPPAISFPFSKTDEQEVTRHGQGNGIKKDVYDTVNQTLYVGEILIPPGKYGKSLKKRMIGEQKKSPWKIS